MTGLARSRRLVPWTLAMASLASVVVLGCASQKQGELILEDARSYAEGLRWSRYDDAAAHLPPPERESFIEGHEELDEDLKLDDYEILTVKVKGGQEAKIQVKWTWHLDSSGVVHETVIEQRWAKHARMWLLEAERHVRGERMPEPEITDAELPDGGPADAAAARGPESSPVIDGGRAVIAR